MRIKSFLRKLFIDSCGGMLWPLYMVEKFSAGDILILVDFWSLVDFKRSGKVSPEIIFRGNSSFSRRLGSFGSMASPCREGLKGVDFWLFL